MERSLSDRHITITSHHAASAGIHPNSRLLGFSAALAPKFHPGQVSGSEPSGSHEAPGDPKIFQEATGPGRPQEAPGGPRRPQEAPGRPQGDPREAPGGPRRPQEAPGRVNCHIIRSRSHSRVSGRSGAYPCSSFEAKKRADGPGRQACRRLLVTWAYR